MWFGDRWWTDAWFGDAWWGTATTPEPPTPIPEIITGGSGGFLGSMPRRWRVPWADADPWQRRRRSDARPAIRFKDERYDDTAIQIDEEDAIVALMMLGEQ